MERREVQRNGARICTMNSSKRTARGSPEPQRVQGCTHRQSDSLQQSLLPVVTRLRSEAYLPRCPACQAGGEPRAVRFEWFIVPMRVLSSTRGTSP